MNPCINICTYLPRQTNKIKLNKHPHYTNYLQTLGGPSIETIMNGDLKTIIEVNDEDDEPSVNSSYVCLDDDNRYDDYIKDREEYNMSRDSYSYDYNYEELRQPYSYVTSDSSLSTTQSFESNWKKMMNLGSLVTVETESCDDWSDYTYIRSDGR